MIRNRDIVVIGIQPWDITIGSNCKNIAVEFARQNRVLYVNSPLDRITMYRDKSKPGIQQRIRVQNGTEPDMVKLQDNLWNLNPVGLTESINFIKQDCIYDILNKRNSRIFAKAVNSAIERLGFRDVILFNDSSMFLGVYMKELIRPATYVYYMRDYLTRNPYWRRHGVRLEPILIKKADVVVNNSTLYAKYGQQFNPHSYMVGQGCDVSLFNDKQRDIEIAHELSTIPRPIIGYVGFLSSRRLDIGVLAFIAKQQPEWSIVLVGPEDDEFRQSELHSIKNIYFLGSRDSSVLPEYIKGFDVCINPQLVNDATIGNYPRKIDEYLAMGKPTVATVTEAMEYFRHYTYLAVSHKDYIDLIQKALAEDSTLLQDERRSFANSHTWENNVNEIYKAIEKVTAINNH
jgi:glycosyltransferase involved in cell wall biosynthesis